MDKEDLKFWIWLVVCLGFIAVGLTNMVISGADRAWPLVSIVVGLVGGFVLGLITDSGLVAAIVVLLGSICCFSFSGTMAPADIDHFAVVERGDSIKIYKDEDREITRPFSGVRCHHIGKFFELQEDGFLDAGDSGVIHWEVSAKFRRADYDQFFSVIMKAGGFEEWREEVRGTFQEVIDQRLSQFDPDEEILPSSFSFNFTEEQSWEMTELGARPNGEIKASGMEILK